MSADQLFRRRQIEASATATDAAHSAASQLAIADGRAQRSAAYGRRTLYVRTGGRLRPECSERPVNRLQSAQRGTATSLSRPYSVRQRFRV